MARKFNVVIIGGSAAGVSAALTSRRHYPDKSVIFGAPRAAANLSTS